MPGRRCGAIRSDVRPRGTAQIVLITGIMAPLTYIAASTNLPMQDANLLALDRALHLDWRPMSPSSTLIRRWRPG
jgi:hypothetical protein